MEDTSNDCIICAGCLNVLNEENYISALGNDWHTECFRCSVCDRALSSWYFEKDGLLFCQVDYWNAYGEACQQCTQVITGPVMVAGEHRFHPECFACGCCSSFIEDGEPYALVERSKLYCGVCYKQYMQPLERGATAHSIRVVEVPPLQTGPERAPLIRLAHGELRGSPITPDYACRGVTIKEMDSSCGLMTLHIGDKILEINGTPIHDQPLNVIERVLCYSDTVLQLTIEHDPDSSRPGTRASLYSCDTPSREVKNVAKFEGTLGNKTDIPERHSASDNVVKDNQNIPTELCVARTHNEEGVSVKRNVSGEDCRFVGNNEVRKVKERVFKKRVEGTPGKTGRALRRRGTPASPQLGEKERSSSMSRLLDVVDSSDKEPTTGVLCDLSRARSFRVEPATSQRVFRACDLLQGELLGCGFFGQVYKVTHRDTNEVMVLKQLYRVDEDAQKNFLKEVAVLRSLSHTNVLRFIGVLYKDKRLHLITEYVAGGTLRELLQDCNSPLSWDKRTKLACDIAAGLAYLHRMNVIHRDLNSHNCLVREDKTVIVADFGLARIVQRCGMEGRLRGSTGTVQRKKRYTVVGNPYWMAPEMMKGNVYDEKVDIFSFGIILCEIIGRVHADPDYLPRRSDFGLNETLFREKFCQDCPESLLRIAFLCCDLNPDKRPPFEVMEVWLKSLMMHLSVQQAIPADLLLDIIGYVASEGLDAVTPTADLVESVRISQPSPIKVAEKESSEAPPPTTELPTWKMGLGPKCVSASQICPLKRPDIKMTNLSRSQNYLSHVQSGYIVRADGKNINITKVNDIAEWLDPPNPNKQSKTDPTQNAKLPPDIMPNLKTNSSKDEFPTSAENIPSFLRNQSVEGLESNSKDILDMPQSICRHFSIPDHSPLVTDGDKTKTDDNTENVVSEKQLIDSVSNNKPKQLSQQSKFESDDQNKGPFASPVRANVKRVQRSIINTSNQAEKCAETKTNFITKNLMSPKLGRLFTSKHRSEVPTDEVKNKPKSKFFIQNPTNPVCKSLYRVQPLEYDMSTAIPSIHVKNAVGNEALKIVKSAKPTTPIFSRSTNNKNNQFKDARFSYREKRFNFPTELVLKSNIDETDNKLNIDDSTKTPLSRCSNSNNIPSLCGLRDKNYEHKPTNEIRKEHIEKVHREAIALNNKLVNCNQAKVIDTPIHLGKKMCDTKMEGDKFAKEHGISRSNYVSLANLKINCKTPEELLSKYQRELESKNK